MTRRQALFAPLLAVLPSRRDDLAALDDAFHRLACAGRDWAAQGRAIDAVAARLAPLWAAAVAGEPALRAFRPRVADPRPIDEHGERIGYDHGIRVVGALHEWALAGNPGEHRRYAAPVDWATVRDQLPATLASMARELAHAAATKAAADGLAGAALIVGPLRPYMKVDAGTCTFFPYADSRLCPTLARPPEERP